MADEECFPGGVDDLGGGYVEFVEGLDAFDLGDEPVDEAEVTSGDADDGGDGCGVSDPAVICVAGVGELMCQDGGEFLGSEGPVFVREADAAVELG